MNMTRLGFFAARLLARPRRLPARGRRLPTIAAASADGIGPSRRDARRRCSTSTSALYVSGEDAQSRPFVVEPDLDFDGIFANFDVVLANVRSRCLADLAADLAPLPARWRHFRDARVRRSALESEKLEIADSMKVLAKGEGDGESADRKARLKARGREVRAAIKEATREMWALEGELIPTLLRLPNALNPQTPVSEFQKQMDTGEKPSFDFKPKRHMAIGAVTDTVSHSPVGGSCYLRGAAAELEGAIVAYFGGELLAHGFTPLSSPDTFTSAVVEGCGRDWRDASEVLSVAATTDGDARHLVGVSALPFCALHARTVVGEATLPLRYYTVGRCYAPPPAAADAPSLLSTAQATTVDVCGLARDDAACNALFGEFSRLLASRYSALGLPCQTALVPASHLGQAETLRVELQVYLPGYNRYVETAHVSLYGDYVARRLAMRWSPAEANQRRAHLHMVHGTVVNVPYLIACIMENMQRSDGTFVVPPALAKHLPK